jgi:hypothetical protein
MDCLNAVMKLRGLQKGENLFASWTVIRFSRRFCSNEFIYSRCSLTYELKKWSRMESRISTEAVDDYFKVLSLYSCAQRQSNHEQSQLGKSITRRRFEICIPEKSSRILSLHQSVWFNTSRTVMNWDVDPSRANQTVGEGNCTFHVLHKAI